MPFEANFFHQIYYGPRGGGCHISGDNLGLVCMTLKEGKEIGCRKEDVVDAQHHKPVWGGVSCALPGCSAVG